MNRRKALKNIALSGASVGALNLEAASEVECERFYFTWFGPALVDPRIKNSESFTPSELIEDQIFRKIEGMVLAYNNHEKDPKKLESIKKHLQKSNLRQILKGIDKFFPKRAIV